MAGWGTCYSASNNIHFNFPPIMNDGRNYASWQPEAVINAHIQKENNITSNWNYRQYMTNNGLKIMKTNNSEACANLGLPVHFHSDKTPGNDSSSNVPYLYKSTYDTHQPGYGYSNSSLKSPYLTREQLQSRMVSPAVSFPPISQVNK